MESVGLLYGVSKPVLLGVTKIPCAGAEEAGVAELKVMYLFEGHTGGTRHAEIAMETAVDTEEEVAVG